METFKTRSRRFLSFSGLGLAASLALVAGDAAFQAKPHSHQDQPVGQENPPTPDQTRKQQKDLLKFNFGEMKRDADKLAELAKSLQEDLGKTNENVLSLDVVHKAERIEKLAKKIKETAKGY